ncbi:Ig-like domain repeat protein [Methanobrevibacter sp.]
MDVAEMNDDKLNIYENDENSLNSLDIKDDTLSQNTANQTDSEILMQNQNDEILSDFAPFYTQIEITVNDTSNIETTGNITMNMHFSFRTPWSDGEFSTYNIHIYENDTLIKKINIGDLNLPDVKPSVTYIADVPFTYTVHPNSYLTTSLFGTYSNTLHFKEIKSTILKNLNITQINIDNTYSSNRSWTNSVKSLQKATDLATPNGIITLKDITLIQDTTETIQINKNLTIVGKNASIILEKTQTLINIQPNTELTLINLTFIGNNKYILSNKGNLKLINCIFKDNSLGLIDNDGELEIENCKIEDINKFYQTRPTNTKGLIKNTKTVKITNTTFTNKNSYLPYNIPCETSLNGIIYNKGNLQTQNVNFTNINYRIIYNEGESFLNNTLFEDITSASATAIYTISTNTKLNEEYSYDNFKIQNKEKTDGGAIYNKKEMVIINSMFKNIIGNDGGAIYNNEKLTLINTTLQKITGNNGGAIYSTKELIIINSTVNTTIGDDGGAIYNTKELTIMNSLFNNTQSRATYHNGGAIYNKGTSIIVNSTITQSKIVRGFGGGICNNGTLTLDTTIISECSGEYDVGGAGIHNNGVMNINNCQIISNNVPYPYHEVEYSGIVMLITNVYAGVISNSETGKTTITKSIIKDNTIYHGHNGNWQMYFGTIKNNGEMKITSCILDNNTPSDWDTLWGGEGSINIYNTGKLTYMYNYLLNTQYYTGSPHDPFSFLYNTGLGTCNINYNFFCLDPEKIIQNAAPNYYFIPSFNDYIPIKLNENANITLTLGLSNGIDKLDFDDWDKLLTPGLNATITTLNENGEYINITTFLKDKYSFNFNYTNTKGEYLIYCNILNYTNTGIIDVGKEFSEMTVTYNNITYNDGNKITFHVKVTGNLTVQPTGNVTFTYNNQKTTLNLTNGECNYTITETLKPANYTMRIDYNGDDEYFKIIKQLYPFTVNKISTNITLSAPEIRIGETGKAIITVTPGDAKLYGYLYYITDREYETNADTRGTRTINLKNFDVGTYNLTVIFKEDEYYTGGTASTLFIVGKWETSMNITADDVKPGENTTVINITINPGDVRGEAIVEINGKNQTVYLNDTTTRIPVTNLEEGTYQVTVYYFGDAKYAPSNGTTTFSVARITSNITADISYDEHMNGHITVNTNYKNCTGEVGLYINNDDQLKLNLTQGKANFTAKFKRGVNYIYIYYYGDEYYSFSTWNTTFSIDATPVLSLETQDLRSDSTGYVRINLTDTNNIPYEYTDITIEFNNQTTILKTDENGTVYYPVQLPAGKYSIKATYGNATIIKNITVKTPTKITVEIPPINQDEDLMVYVTLTDYNNQKITGDVIIEINGQYYRVIVTEGSGSRNLGELKAGNYKYNATYIGEGLLSPSQTTGTFNVALNNYKITGNKNINAYYGANKNYKIQLLNNNKPVKDAIITIKINKNTVQVKTDSKGYATLKLSLKAGKYTIVSTCKNVKVSNKIVIKPTLITKNKKIKKGKTLTYTAKLLNKNGKKLKNKKITFKINGKKYKAKTNKKGIAKIKVKNLKKGKYKIKTSYGKLKNTNTITVK